MKKRMPKPESLDGAEKALLVGLVLPGKTRAEVDEHLSELEALTASAGGRAVGRLVQQRGEVHPGTFVSRGKAEELRQLVEGSGAQLVIFDDDLRPTQFQKLEELLGVRVIDRTGLILDIFARRAATREARIQVELAQLQYLLPRLAGLWRHLERQQGGIGMRGVGEKQIEIDRRLTRTRISRLRRELAAVQVQRQTRRKRRRDLRRVALVGYTNAGKSTLFNALTRASVPAEDRLFSTLDTTVRPLRDSGRAPILLSDTVGFIRKLPHLLVESFKGTLEEAVEADLLLQVVDASHPGWRDHLAASAGVLQELGIGDKPAILVLNKLDRWGPGEQPSGLGPAGQPLAVAVSAVSGENLDRLRRMILDQLALGGSRPEDRPAPQTGEEAPP